MKKIVLFSILSFFSILSIKSQIVAETRSVGSFEGIVVTGNIQVLYSYDNVHSIKIEARKGVSAQLDIKLAKDLLVIKPKKGYKPQGDIFIHITAPMLREVDISGSSRFIANYLDKSDKLVILAEGSSTMRLGMVRTTNMTVELYGSSSIDAKIDTESFDIQTSGSSSVDIELWAKNINADLSGSSIINMKGKTDKINSVCAGTSVLDIRNLVYKTIVLDKKLTAEIKK